MPTEAPVKDPVETPTRTPEKDQPFDDPTPYYVPERLCPDQEKDGGFRTAPRS